MNKVEIKHAPSARDLAVVAAIRAQSAAFKGKLLSPQARAAYDSMLEAVPAASDVEYEQSSVGGVGGVWCKPQAAIPGAAILFLHGGGYVVGSAQAYRHFAGQFAARSGVAVFVAEYARAPEQGFPSAGGDARAAYRGLLAQGFSNIALVGDSAGGGLSLVTLAATRNEKIAPCCCVVISPWTDLSLSGGTYFSKEAEDPFLTLAELKTCVADYLGTRDPQQAAASPILGELGGLAPTQIHVGTSEILLDDALRYAERAHSQGGQVELHVWQGMPHVFPSSLGALDAAEAALGIMGDFLRGHLRG